MITAEWKPIEEMVGYLRGHKKVLLIGCATCVAECAAGGEREVETLAPLLAMAFAPETRARGWQVSAPRAQAAKALGSRQEVLDLAPASGRDWRYDGQVILTFAGT